jgi:plasmid stabilization system protein ParE
MAKIKKVVWTQSAIREKYDILDFWELHNKSASYSIKLNEEIEEAIYFISIHSNAGTLMIDNVRKFLVREYYIIYELNSEDILILAFWDGRQDPEKLTKRLE